MPAAKKAPRKKSPKKTAPAKATPKPAGKNFLPVFTALCELLAPYEDRLRMKTDQSGYWMHSLEPTLRDRPMFFAGIRMGKNYVSFHLMPVYCCPELKTMSPALKKRMQGKACFNFKEVDEACFSELSVLVKSGYRAFKEKKWV
jgi:hypothetical protein